MSTYIAHRRLDFAQTDLAGVAHFAEYFRILESVEHQFLRENGLSVVMDLDNVKVSWPRVSCGFDFFLPLRFEEDFEVHLSIERVGEKSVTYRGEFRRGDGLLARGRCTAVCCSLSEGGLEGIPIPEVYRDLLCRYQWESSAD